MTNCECIEMDAINKALKETFKFIKDNPTHKNSTIINVNVCLLKTESNFDLTPNHVATNTIYGNVVEVYDTLLKFEYVDSKDKKIVYTISYDSIISIIDESIDVYYEKYIEKMKKTPNICKIPESNAIDINIIKNLKNMNIIFLIDGALSREFRVEDVEYVKNLIILESFIILPITKISGFVYNSFCDANSIKSNYNTKSLWS